MLDKATRDSAYLKEYHDFMGKLQRFHDGKRTSFTRVPSFGGKDLDLLLLYKTVTSLGGFSKVTDEKKWPEVAKCLNLPLKCTNGAFALRQHYIRYLEHYERVIFFGEDSEDAVVDGSRQALGLSAVRTPQPSLSLTMPSNQEIMKPPALGPFGEIKTHNFTRLLFSLASGLPNEVDFALNICTLLSNVSNSIFNLAKAPGIVDLMLLHAGVWTTETVNAQDMYKEWYQESERDFVKFWREALDDNCAKELFESGLSGSDLIEKLDPTTDEEEDRRVLFADCTVDVNHAETNRVLQICVILHNFSLEDLNAMFLATHRGARRFLLICAGTRQPSLRRIALDTLDNLAERFELTKLFDQENQKFLQILHNFLESKDRLRRVRAMTILAKLASCEDNEEILSEGMTLGAYESLIKALTIPDIQMILASLDALYFLSHLGEATSTSIAMVYGAIDVLICLVTVQAESYGNRAIAGFRIVENKNSVYSQKHQAQRAMKSNALRHSLSQVPHPQAVGSVSSQNFMRTPPVRSLPFASESQRQPLSQQQVAQADLEETEEIDAEVFTAQWISAFYELSPGHVISRSDMYSDYLVTCNRLGRLGILPASNFNKILRMVIPEQHLQGTQTNLDGHYNISGVRRRATPLPVQSRVPRQRSSVPVVGLHGTSPRSALGIPQSQRVSMSAIHVQRPMAAPFMQGQHPPLSPSENFQPPRLRAEFPAVQVKPNLQSGPPPLSGPGPLPSAAQAVPTQLPTLGPRAPAVTMSGESRSEPLSVIPANPITAETVKVSGDAGYPTVSVNPTSASAINQGMPLPPGTISLPFSAGAQGQDGLTQYQTAMEHIKREMQQHYMQFHLHRQQIQSIQIQLQQAVQQSQGQQLPQNVMEDVQARVRSHHAQMQHHYQKLQHLQVLMQQVQQKASQEQQGAKESTVEGIPPSPKSKRSKKNSSATPKQMVGAASAVSDTTAQQRTQQANLAMSSSFGPSKLIPSSPTLSVSTSMQQTGVNPMWKPESQLPVAAQTDASIENGRGLSIVQQVVPISAAMVNGAQGNIRDTGAEPWQGKGPGESHNLLVMNPMATGAVGGNVLGVVQAQQTSLAASLVRPAIGATAGSMTSASSQADLVPKVSVRPSVPPPPVPLAQTSQGAVVFQNAVAPTSVVATPQPARFMIVHGPPQGIPPNGVQRGLPPNAMVMMSSVVTQPFSPSVVRFPAVATLAQPSDQRQQVVLSRENGANQVATSQGAWASFAPFMSQGNLHTVSTPASTFPPIVASSSVAVVPSVETAEGRPSDSVISTNSLSQLPTTEAAVINDKGDLDSLDTSASIALRGSDSSCIPVHQQNGSVYKLGKRQASQHRGQLHAVTGESKCENRDSLEQRTVVTTHQNILLATDSSVKVLDTLAKRNEENITLTVSKPISHVEQAKKLCDELFVKEGLDKDCKRLKLAGEVTKLEKQEASNYVLNGMLDTKVLQKHEKSGEKHDVWLNGRHAQNNVKSKENGFSKHIESINENGITSQTAKNPLPYNVASKTAKDSFVDELSDLKATHEEERQSTEDQEEDDEELSSQKVSESFSSDHELSTTHDWKDDNRDIRCDSSSDGMSSKSSEKNATSEPASPDPRGKECRWEGCSSSFTTSSNLLSHMVCAHAPVEGQLGICRIPGCSSVQRPRGSMICHFQQRHCNPSGSGDDLPLVTLPELLFPKVADVEKKEDESPVTRSVRLTSALILRNIARNSSYGRQLIRGHEGKLVLSAMSTSEASSAVASCLAELSKTRTSKSSFSEEDS